MTTNTPAPTPETNRELIKLMDTRIQSIIGGLVDLKVKMNMIVDMFQVAKKIKEELGEE